MPSQPMPSEWLPYRQRPEFLAPMIRAPPNVTIQPPSDDDDDDQFEPEPPRLRPIVPPGDPMAIPLESAPDGGVIVRTEEDLGYIPSLLLFHMNMHRFYGRKRIIPVDRYQTTAIEVPVEREPCSMTTKLLFVAAFGLGITLLVVAGVLWRNVYYQVKKG